MKKKLLFVNGHLNVGGVEKSLTDLLCHLDYAKYDVDLLLLEDKGDYFQQIPQQINILFFDTTKAYGTLLSVLMRNMLARQWQVIAYRVITLIARKFGKKVNKLLYGLFSLNKNYDAAIAYRVGSCAEIVAYTVKAKRKLLWWHHGEINVGSSTIIDYDETWKYFNNIATVSQSCKEMLVNTFNYPSDKIAVVPNMVDIDKIVDLAGDKSPYNSADEKINVVSVGRLCVEKHFEDAIYVAKKLVNEGVRNFHWYIIGDGELHDNLSAQINEQCVGDFITLLGKKVNPYPWMKFAHIYVHPSYVESQGLTILEAMALGTPCVVCCSAGPSEFIVDGVNGILTKPNADSLYRGVVRLLGVNNKMISVENALETVTEKFSANTIINTFEKLL